MLDRVALAGLSLALLTAVAATSGALTANPRRVEVVPAGSEWLVGHPGGDRVGSVVASPPSAFLDAYGGLWSMRRSGPTGGFIRIWGEGIGFDPAVMHDPDVANDLTERFWAENPYLLPRGVFAADLARRTSVEWNGIRLVAHTQTHDGVPVLGTGTYAVFMAGRLVLLGVRTFAVDPLETAPATGEHDAVSAALAFLDSRGLPATAGSARLAIMPLVDEDLTRFSLVWEVPLSSGVGGFTAYVDAAEGGLVALRDERLFMDGTINLSHHDRNPAGDFISGPGYYLDLATTGGNTTADGTGAFGATGTAVDVAAGLSGAYVDVQTQTGTDLEMDAGVSDGETYLWAVDGGEIEQSQLDVYAFTSVVHEHTAAHFDDVDWLEEPIVVRPNHFDMDGDENQDFCNAWSDGDTINFLMAGSYGSYSCNNTAMIADIVYHEYGHGIHIQNVYMGVGIFDEAVSEAFADTMSVSITNDSVIGRYFVTSGQGIRDLEPDKVWPADVSDDPHQTGLILGGALWDLRTHFIGELGETAGRALADEIFFGMLRVTGDMPSAYEAALVADDDNGDLSDGTPNLCAIYGAFAAHGLNADGVGLVSIAHEQIEEIDDPSEPIAVEADVWVTQEECSTLGDVTVSYSVDEGGTWSEVAMVAQSGDTFRAEIPAQPLGTILRYRIEAEDADSGDVIVKPDNAAEPYYEAYVGPLAMIFCDDLETENAEWTHELLAGEDIEGADDWHWGTPPGKGGDPDHAFSGTHVWGNDLAPLDNWNGQYQADRVNTLRSPAWDLSGYEAVRLRFRRWLAVEDGYYDQASVYVNEQLVWTNHVSPGAGDDHSTHHIDKEWILEDIDITSLAAGEESVQVRWEIASDQGMQFGGWNIDDVCMYTTGEVEEPDGSPDADTDADADGGSDAAVEFGAISGCGCDAVDTARPAGSLLRALVSLL